MISPTKYLRGGIYMRRKPAMDLRRFRSLKVEPLWPEEIAMLSVHAQVTSLKRSRHKAKTLEERRRYTARIKNLTEGS
jgi:hypothetical protein